MRIDYAGTYPLVVFTENERAEILRVAQERAVIGTDFRELLHTYLEGEAATINRVGNHITGELTERAVAAWLADNGIQPLRPASLREEITQRLPDIRARGMKLDVKSKIDWPNFWFPRSQVKDDPDLGVIWCKPERREADYPLYDTKVPESAYIYGWATMAEVGAVEPEGGIHPLPRARLRPPAHLIDWITSGQRPPPLGTPHLGP